MSDLRLSGREVNMMLALATRGGIVMPISMERDHREVVVPLWRRQLVELWFRRPPAEHSSQMHGPFYRLTNSGAQLALAIHEKRKLFGAAPRAISGAGEA